MADFTENQKDLSKTIINLKIQIEEVKRTEEILKNQLTEKENSCLEMEKEIMDLRRKVTTHKISVTLNEILDCQKSSNDRTGLGYNKMMETS